MPTHPLAAIDAACLMLSDAQARGQHSEDALFDLAGLFEVIDLTAEDARLTSHLARIGRVIAEHYNRIPTPSNCALESVIADLRAIVQESDHE